MGLPVICISAQKEENLDALMEEAYKASLEYRKGKTVLSETPLNHLIGDCKAAFKGLDVAHPLFHAIKLIEMDELEVYDHPSLVKIVDEFKKTFEDEVFGDDLEAIIADARYKHITNYYSTTRTMKKKAIIGQTTKSDKIDRVFTNKWLGIPIFLVILFMIFHLTFSENLFFLGGLF